MMATVSMRSCRVRAVRKYFYIRINRLVAHGTYRKMRSDEILMDAEERARAHVLTAPPGTDPRDYEPRSVGGRGRARGRGGRGRGRGGPRRRGGDRMDMD